MKKKRKVLKLVIAFTMGIALLFFARYAVAISISRSIIAFDAALGQDYSTSLVIANEQESTVHISIFLKDCSLDIKGVPQIFEPGTLKESLANRISVNAYEFDLEPGEKKTVQINVEAPKEHEGARWAYLIIRGRPSKGIEVTKGELAEERRIVIRVVTNLPIPVLQTDPSSAKVGRVKDMKIVFPKNSNTQKAQIEVRTVFQNVGDDFVTITKHYVEIRDSDGDTIAKIENAQKPFIFPGGERLLIANYDRDLLAGTYLALSVVDFGGDYLAAGQRVFKIEND